jgi:hypothetical protein
MQIHLYWQDKNWEDRGYANNYNLIVYMEDKTYKVYTNPYYDYNMIYDIEVKRKSDITDYIEYLKDNGYMEVK